MYDSREINKIPSLHSFNHVEHRLWIRLENRFDPSRRILHLFLRRLKSRSPSSSILVPVSRLLQHAELASLRKIGAAETGQKRNPRLIKGIRQPDSPFNRQRRTASLYSSSRGSSNCATAASRMNAFLLFTRSILLSSLSQAIPKIHVKFSYTLCLRSC